MAEPRPILVFDGECGFCRNWVDRLHALVGDKIEYTAFQAEPGRFPVARADFQKAVHLIEPNRTCKGAEAIFRALSYAPGRGHWLWAYESIPGFAPVSEGVYRFVANHRALASKATRLFLGRDVDGPAAYTKARWLYLRLFGLTALIAVSSFWAQLGGLLGKNGIWPAADTFTAYASQLGPGGFWQLPSLAWLSTSDLFLNLLCAAGVLASLAVLVNLAPRIALLVFWASWSSLVAAGGPFLSFQWDILLIEASFVSFLYAPRGLRPRAATECAPSGVSIFLMRYLVFRLMLLNGLVKILSEDPAWRDFTAFSYHHWTQPLPTWTSYALYRLPEVFQKATCLLTLMIELILPWGVFWPRMARRVSFVGLFGLQLALMAAGNYSYFNLLSAVLCLVLLDDGWIAKLWPKRLRQRVPSIVERYPSSKARGFASVAVLTAIVLVGADEFFQRLRKPEFVPRWIHWLTEKAEPWRTVNSYGAFEVMTKTRPEIIVEGSRDGVSWTPYEFRYKPGALDRRPEFVAPFQPRLDWQMWFAALGSCRQNPWFLSFQRHLLLNTPEVTQLLGRNPFADSPPQFVRSMLFQYHFSREPGVWWERSEPTAYCPTLTLEGDALKAVP